jgi:hypothetical protein
MASYIAKTDSDPLRRRGDFNPMALHWPVTRIPWSPLRRASEAPTPAIVPGEPFIYVTKHTS